MTKVVHFEQIYSKFKSKNKFILKISHEKNVFEIVDLISPIDCEGVDAKRNARRRVSKRTAQGFIVHIRYSDLLKRYSKI